MRRWALGAASALALSALLLLHAFVYPLPAPASSVDAVVLLAGDSAVRLGPALRLAEEGPRVLVVSAGGGEDNAAASAMCDRSGDLTVYCFSSIGLDTRAEARVVGRLVAERGWSRIAVVTSSYHARRAGLLIRRCTDAHVSMVVAWGSYSGPRWARAIVHEIGGLAGAAVHPSC